VDDDDTTHPLSAPPYRRSEETESKINGLGQRRTFFKLFEGRVRDLLAVDNLFGHADLLLLLDLKEDTVGGEGEKT
jgi:hypothetical protein